VDSVPHRISIASSLSPVKGPSIDPAINAQDAENHQINFELVQGAPHNTDSTQRSAAASGLLENLREHSAGLRPAANISHSIEHFDIGNAA
jgi:hypothetical protein